MKLSTVKSEGLSREYKVVIPSKDIMPVYESRLAAYAKDFSMPGFRKGKVPSQHVKARYGYRVFQEAAESLIQKSQEEALEKEGVKVLGQPKISVDKMENEAADLEYTLSVDLVPEFPKLDLKAFKAKKMTVNLSDKDVQGAIETQFKDFPMYKKSSAKKAVLGGAVQADLTFTVGGKAEKPSKDKRVELLEARKDDKIVKALVGVAVGAELTVDLDPIEEKGKKKDISCKIKVLELLERAETKFDDAFAKEVGFKSFDEMKKHTMSNMEKGVQSKSRACLKRELLDFIDTKAQFDVPSSMVDAELETILRQVKAEMTETEKKENPDDSLRKEYADIANRRVRLGLFLSDLGTQKKISVTNEELSQEIYRLAAQSGTDVKKIVEYVRNNPAALNSLQAPIFEERVVDLLLSEMKLEEEKVTLKALDKHYDEVLSADMPDQKDSKKSTEKKADKPKAAAKKKEKA